MLPLFGLLFRVAFSNYRSGNLPCLKSESKPTSKSCFCEVCYSAALSAGGAVCLGFGLVVVVSPSSRGLPRQMPTLFKHHSQAEEVKVAFV